MPIAFIIHWCTLWFSLFCIYKTKGQGHLRPRWQVFQKYILIFHVTYCLYLHESHTHSRQPSARSTWSCVWWPGYTVASCAPGSSTRVFHGVKSRGNERYVEFIGIWFHNIDRLKIFDPKEQENSFCHLMTYWKMIHSNLNWRKLANISKHWQASV